MLRPDFGEIFDYVTYKAMYYSLNTNGTLITPEIARLLRRKGAKMVVLYGATRDVHDHITRISGSFDSALQGLAYLKEWGAGFIVQIIPMKDNYHQFRDMVSLAQSLSPQWRIGASWLYLSACGDHDKNNEIMRQRLEPKDVIKIESPDPSYHEWTEEDDGHRYAHVNENDRLLDSCIQSRREFHIDPYGQMTFCSFIKDPNLRYDLRKGRFTECWEDFIPSLSDKVKGGGDFLEDCGSCELRKDCRWCPAYGYLEHGKYNAKVEYLCDVAKENRNFKDDWIKNHRRYYHIAGITIQVDSDLPREITLRGGETFSQRADEQINVKIGNAGGVNLIFNGEPLGPLGGPGKIVRLSLTKSGYEFKTRDEFDAPGSRGEATPADSH